MKYKAQTTEKPAKYHLRIADAENRSIIMRDLDTALTTIRFALRFTADCEGKEALKKCDTLLWAILTDNQ